jgi:hypothetical protein
VPDGERRHIRELTEVGAFIAPYLAQMGVRLGAKWKVWLWLFRR